MHVTQTIKDFRHHRHLEPGLTWGLVPTMGALHEGHLSLVRRAAKENDRVAVSIFVNPTQFSNVEDLSKYPRDLDADAELLSAAGVDLIWAPTEQIVYPNGHQTTVTVAEVTQPLEGAHRPGHFQGVATIVSVLFNVIQPHRAYFGQKDAQQVAVLKQMVRDLAFPLEIVVCPLVREPDGLAVSSRNTRLEPAERETAIVLYRALSAAVEQFDQGMCDADHLRDTMNNILAAEKLARVDYVSVADPLTLQEIKGEVNQALLSMAVYIGDIRLIDNMTVGYDPTA